MRIAITGHQGLPAHVAAEVDAEIRRRLACLDGPVRGLTCLADGADQIFARAVLDMDGQIEVTIPAAEYRDGLAAVARPAYDELLAAADSISRLDHVESNEQAHMDASAQMIERADEVWAVWDGKPARGYGGTADVVGLARDRGLPVVVIWPDGASRDE